MEQKQEKVWAMFCHLGALGGAIIPFGNIIIPLVIWLIQKKESALVDREGKKSLNFQISMTIYALVSAILVFVVIGIFLLWAIAIFSLVAVIIAAIKTNNGEDYKYPLSLTLIK